MTEKPYTTNPMDYAGDTDDNKAEYTDNSDRNIPKTKYENTLGTTIVQFIKKDIPGNFYGNYSVLPERKMNIVATAYTSNIICCGKDDGITSSGVIATGGTIAAPSDIPFGTKIKINGLGTFKVQDRGGAIVRVNSNTIRVDIWKPTYWEALKFGVQRFTGEVVN